MYRVKSIVNNACNLDVDKKFKTKVDAEDYLDSLRISFQLATNKMRDSQDPEHPVDIQTDFYYLITKLTKNVSVYTLNIGTGHIVYTFYLIQLPKKEK